MKPPKRPPPMHVIREFQRMLAEKDMKKAFNKAHFGNIRLGSHVVTPWGRLISVGGIIYKVEENDCKTFPEFISIHLVEALGRQWWDAESQKPKDQQHRLIEWCGRFCDWRDSPEYLPENPIPDGAVAEWLGLAFDIYALKHLNCYKDQIVRRMIDDSYPGARFELAVAATILRAGFDIEQHDEKVFPHIEFFAVHKATGQRMAVEAKTKCRPGTLGCTKERRQKETLRLHTKVNEALKKKPRMPFVVFVEANLPYTESLMDSKWPKEIVSTCKKLEAEHEPFPANMIFFINDPSHYNVDEPLRNQFWVQGMVAGRPEFPLTNPVEIYQQIDRAIKQSLYIPWDFD